MYPPSIQKLIEQFSKFPTVGPRTAARFVFYLLQLPKREIEELVKLISNIQQSVKQCLFCFNHFEGEGNLCQICSDPTRDRSLLCIVEKEQDLVALEKINKYKGLYFILGGTVSTLKKTDIEKLRIRELKNRLMTPEKFGILGAHFKEIIIATNPTTEGEATFLYLERLLKNFSRNRQITRLGRGLPVGAELEYADEETLSNAFDGRR